MSVRFDASGDSLTRTANIPASPFTVMFWVYISVDRNAYSCFFDLDTGSGDVPYIGTNATGTNLDLYLTGGGGDHLGSNLSVTTWYHIALTYSDPNWTLYLDGVSDVTASSSNPLGTTMRIGNDGASEFLNGKLAALKIYSAILTQAEILQERLFYTPVRTANLNSWYPFLSHSDVVDYSGSGNSLTTNGTLATEDGPPIAWRRGTSRIFIPGAAAAPSSPFPPFPIYQNTLIRL